MDNRTFDGLARTVAETISTRRGALHGLGGGLIAALLAQFGVEEAAAKCVKIGGRCKKRGEKLKCCGGAKCQGPRCMCTGGKIACRGRCIAAECCTHQDCGPRKLCARGTCIIGQGTCAAGADACGAGPAPCGQAGSGCYCLQSTTNQTRCAGGELAGPCGECINDAECATAYPSVPGVFCVQSGDACCPGSTFCSAPCPD